MCGRFAQGVSLDQLPQQLGHVATDTNSDNGAAAENHATTDAATDDIRVDVGDHQWHLNTADAHQWHPLYNIAPTNNALILYSDPEAKKPDHYRLELSSFGLVPFYLKPAADQSADEQRKAFRRQQLRTFNCRSDTLTLKHLRVWNSVKNHHRCVIPAQGYFEWTTIKEEKVPHFVHYAHAPFIFLVGLYSHNVHYADDIPRLTFTICTGPAASDDNHDILWLHSRKPILIAPGLEAWYKWLNPELNLTDVQDVVLNTKDNAAYKNLEIYRVSSAVGNVRQDGAKLIKPVEQGSISDFFTSDPDAETGGKVKSESGSNDANDAKYSSDDAPEVKDEDETSRHDDSERLTEEETKPNRQSNQKNAKKSRPLVKTEDDDDYREQLALASDSSGGLQSQYQLRKRKQPSLDIANMVTTSPREPRSPQKRTRRTRRKRE